MKLRCRTVNFACAVISTSPEFTGHGFASRWTSVFFFVPYSGHTENFYQFHFIFHSIFLIFSPSLKIYHLSLFIITLDAFDIADPIAVCRRRVITNLARHESPSSSVVTAFDRCTESHRFDFRRRLRFFLCPMLVIYCIDVFHLS